MIKKFRSSSLYTKHMERRSYSQCGEDRIIWHVFRAINVKNVRYLDVGAYDPVELSNTYLFYRLGGSGVLVEPDPSLCRRIRAKRKRDVCVNAGLTARRSTDMDFYVMSAKTLNTFSKEEAFRLRDKFKIGIDDIIKVPVLNINSIVEDRFKTGMDLLSLDVEGLDFEIISSLDFSKIRPKVVCVETVQYSPDELGEKTSEISNFMNDNDYFTYADTYVNTVYVDRNIWKNE